MSSGSSAQAIGASVFSALGAAGNILLFLAQVPLMRQIIREKSSDAYSWLPSITLMSCMSMWSCELTGPTATQPE